MGLDVEKIREDFPVLQREINGKPIIYFDNACMTLRPVQVIEKICEYYREYPSCGERSLHKLGKRVDEEVEKARDVIKKFINAKKFEEIIFTKNTTEGINLVANSFALGKGDVILTTDKEHNSNLLPWHALAPKGVTHEVVKSNEDNTFSLRNLENQISKGVKLVSIGQTSNLDGVTNPVKEIVKIAHDHGAKVLVDGAQSVPHHPLDVRKLGVDFLAFSGHKMMGPSGIGVLYGKKDLLEKLGAFLVGGGTVVDTTHTKAQFEDLPQKFEAGLQNYAGIIGLGEAARYLMRIGKENVEKHEIELNKRITEGIDFERVSLIGPKEPEKRGGIISFNVGRTSPHEIAMMMDEMENICVRSGAHCVHSWFNMHKLDGSVRASFYLYNTIGECDKFVETLRKVTDLVK
ncbi:MAG: aminotransferase class V-fold PLP-dependent enzyme [Candidatus Aenigmarchaeota archaeon]|nr:aminotransferase class V-fold PLP-dependent enzyme [Candidatus Aenigmarchaeota archaeon]NIQ17549.1 aminotransferase class V-fold PLP-dependent enzyme [Candidatus Aenigmarchaeota archaeon]NIS73127.1 aminotransferase class V-fold PLP-dependent enzyme [Candidatus Aenigmarchaeota archaeon]